MNIEGVLGTTYSLGIFHGPASVRSSGCWIREVQPIMEKSNNNEKLLMASVKAMAHLYHIP